MSDGRRVIHSSNARLPAGISHVYRRLGECNPYDMAVLILLAVLAVLAAVTYGSYAISNDEPVQQHYGELIIAYYRTGFADKSLFHYDNLYLYGGLFDIVAALAQHALDSLDPYAVRHILCASLGIAGIGAAAAVARLVDGSRAGAIAGFALAVCGPWYGAMFNHTKDIPFATAMAGASYFMLRAVRELPRPQRRDVVFFGLLLGAALGVRVLGLLTIGYAGLAMLLRALLLPAASWRSRLSFFAESVIALAPAFIIAYAVMIAAWPWSALAPLNPVRGLIDFGRFDYPIRTLLAGHIYTMGNVPRWYVPTYLAIKLPLLMLVGAAAAVVMLRGRGERIDERRSEIALLATMAVFPVLCEVVDRGPAFTGLRHFLFVVPLLAALAGIGCNRLLTAVARHGRTVQAALGLSIAAALAWNAMTLVRLHPDEYLFFNPLVGGLQGAAGRYDTDYWVNIMPEAVEDLEAYVARLDAIYPGRQYSVAVCGERLPFEKRADAHLRWTSDWSKADFFIAPTHMNCDRALDGAVIATIERLGVPIGVVKDRRALIRPELALHH